MVSANHRRSPRCAPNLFSRMEAPRMLASRSAPSGTSGDIPGNSSRCRSREKPIPLRPLSATVAPETAGRRSAFNLANCASFVDFNSMPSFLPRRSPCHMLPCTISPGSPAPLPSSARSFLRPAPRKKGIRCRKGTQRSIRASVSAANRERDRAAR